MLIRIWMLLLVIALVLGTTTMAGSDLAPAEITESAASDDALAEVCTAAPAPPPAVSAPHPTGQDAIPPSPPVAEIFRPPRLPS